MNHRAIIDIESEKEDDEVTTIDHVPTLKELIWPTNYTDVNLAGLDILSKFNMMRWK